MQGFLTGFTFQQDIPMDLNQAVHLSILPKRMQRMESFIVEESLNSVKIFWLEQEKLIRKLKEVAQKIGDSDKNVVKIILFGSIAERRGVPGSDADKVVLLKKDSKPFIERIPEWLKRFDIRFPVDVFPYTIDEINNPVAENAIKTGIALFEREM